MDTGIGMEPAMQRSAFEPFTQAEQTLARTEGGLGLGLALEGYGRAARRRGRRQQRGPGRGSDFFVKLPLLRERAGAADA